MTDDRLAGLSPEQQRAMLEKLLRERSHRKPLSYPQERLWFLSQLVPDSPVYNIPAAVRLRGPLLVDVLERSLSEILHRHHVLRTTFETAPDGPVQVVRDDWSIECARHDVSGAPEERREEEALALANAETRVPFDLATGPLIRAHLVRLADEDHVFLLVMHHSVSEVWSIALLYRELEAIYEAFLAGRESPLPELPVQYADYARWQRETMTDEALEPDLAYWREALRGPLPLLQLPTDRPRPPVQTFEGAWLSTPCSPELHAALKGFDTRHGVTLYMTLLAAFAALLARTSGQSELVIGSPVAGRNREETEQLVGMFINTVALRIDTSGDPTFAELLSRVRATAVEAFGHQDAPFERVVEAVEPSRHLSHTPLFQVMFTVQNTPSPRLHLAGLEPGHVYRAEQIHNGTTKLDLGLFIEETDAGLLAGAEYRTDLFEPETILRLLGHVEVLLTAAVADPARRISELPLLTPDEERHLLVEVNATRTSARRDTCAHHRFEAHADRAPEALAVEHVGRRLTYGELDARANQVAHHLLARGVRTGSAVGVCVERSLDMVVARLGILKAGAAYVSIDPFGPIERMRLMLADSRCPAVITDAGRAAELGDIDASVVRVDADSEALAAERRERPDVDVRPDDLAYVIYTSGSTGTPKGVALEHRALMNLCCWHQRAFEITPEDRGTQLAGLAFDASVWELWPYLTAGASIHVPDEETWASPELLRDWLNAQGITVTFLATPLAETVMALDWPEESPLRIVLTGGDRLHAPPREGLPFTLVNNYGPTENAVVSTSMTIPQRDGPGPAPPIGRAVDNTSVYVLDRDGRPVPLGTPGELHVGGDSLARGYVGQPALTAEKFVPNPFSGKEGDRLYRTGDLVRMLPDGSIDFLGRNDFQVKIRGFRVELGEIESNLERHPSVRESIVVVDDSEGDRRLVAYLVAADGQRPQAADLRRHLREKLPGYMVPAVFVTLDALPLSPSGKVDRLALPRPEGARRDVESEFVAPGTDLEKTIADAWKEVLTVDRVGTDDNFFDLGGHSMLLVRVNARLKSQLERDVSMVDMFRYPTVGALARHLSGEGAAERTVTEEAESRRTRGRGRLQALRSRRRTGRSEAPE